MGRGILSAQFSQVCQCWDTNCGRFPVQPDIIFLLLSRGRLYDIRLQYHMGLPGAMVCLSWEAQWLVCY